MENVCRLCWQQAYDLSTVFQFKNTHLVADLITEIVPEITIQRNDLLPKLICRNCLDIIVNACELKALSIKNDVKMRALVDVKQPTEFIIKDEPNPESVVQMDEINDQEQGTESFNTRFQLREFSVKLERISDTELVTLKEEPDEVKVQTKTNTIQCTRCERSFTKKHKYERHIDFDHDSNYERYFKCDICWINGGFKLFKLKKNIEIHMEAFHMSYEVVKAKRKVKIANRVEEFECEHCKQQFGTRFGLYRHKKKIHQKDIPYFPCTMCHLWYMKKSRLDRHMKRHNESAKKCKDCNLEFKTKGDLKLHNYIHCDYVEEYVEPGPHKLSCSLCAYQSYSDEDIQSHLPIHQSDFDSGKLLVCVKCSWTFNDYTFLADHTNEHNLKPTHRCLKCNRVYSYGKKLLRHLMRYQTSFCCDFCGHMEIKKPRLEEHIRFVHKKEVCHLCTICGETKPTSHALSSHMQVKHETEKKYKCSLCPKSFRTPAYYRNHQSVHTTEAVRSKV